MAIIGVRLDATREVEVDSDPAKGTEGATKFVLGTLSARVQGILRDKATSFIADQENPTEVNASFRGNEVAYEIVRFGLRGWRGFVDAEGNEIEFRTVNKVVGGTSLPAVPDELLDRLPIAVIQELSEKISGANAVSEVEAGN